MLIDNEFRVAVAAERLWSYLLDVERIVPCLPGAELTEVVDDRTWRGRMKVKFGPVAMAFAGNVVMVERDDGEHRVVLRANGTESKGKGAATAEVTSWLEPDGGETVVKMHADITLQGFVAQVSRGMLPDISAKLTQQFADCLRADMTAGEAEDAAVAGDAVAGEPSPGPTTASAPGAGGGEAPVAPSGAAQPRPGDAQPRPVDGVARPPGSERRGADGHLGGIRLAIWALYRSAWRALARLLGRGEPSG